MADIIQAGKVSVCRKPYILFNDGEHFPIEISFSRNITDEELEYIAATCHLVNDFGLANAGEEVELVTTLSSMLNDIDSENVKMGEKKE